jgi:Fe-S-cluster-containing dehydrogenase component
MQYGFAIDHDRCIGCHACTVACKAENEVPVGSFRTWVKYTEQGRFPDVTRSFLVERCNHCTNAPCVTICPVNALEKRPDGIVDIDRDACIGCRACMQACPYDALYMNDSRQAVEKCHFCAHRIDRGLEPACVTVCPVGAIIPGDLHDPESRISLIVRNNGTQVRRAEQRTGPNVHYVGADEVALNPGSAARPLTYLWSDRPPHKLEPWPDGLPLAPDARVVLDVGHRVEWGWPVSSYLVTKGIAAGAAMLAPFSAILGLGGFGTGYLPEILALVFTLITTALLVEDLANSWPVSPTVTALPMDFAGPPLSPAAPQRATRRFSSHNARDATCGRASCSCRTFSSRRSCARRSRSCRRQRRQRPWWSWRLRHWPRT